MTVSSINENGENVRQERRNLGTSGKDLNDDICGKLSANFTVIRKAFENVFDAHLGNLFEKVVRE